MKHVKCRVLLCITIALALFAGLFLLITGGRTVVRHRTGKKGITVLRQGELSSEMRFLPGEVTPFTYQTPFGSLDGEIFTLTATFAMTAEGGSVTVEYLASLEGALQKNTVRYVIV